MTILDAIVLIILIGFLARGIWVGLIGQLAFLAALVLGFVAAGAYYDQLGRGLAPVVGNPQLAFFITYILLFLLTYLTIILLGKGLKKVMQISLLGWFDRLMGGLFGAGKAIFIAILLFLGAAGFLSATNPLLRNSLSAPYLARASEYLLTFIRNTDLRARFVPRQPAISPLAPLPVPAGQPLRADTEQIGGKKKLVQQRGDH